MTAPVRKLLASKNETPEIAVDQRVEGVGLSQQQSCKVRVNNEFAAAHLIIDPVCPVVPETR